jgi:HTH-type transcriptional regulator/antitoxin HipB
MAPNDDTEESKMNIRTATDLGLVLKEQRRKLGLSQRQVADRIGVSRQWLVDIEKGKPRAEVGLILKAAATLGLQLTSRDAKDHSHQGADHDPRAAPLHQIRSERRRKPQAVREEIDLDALIDKARGGKR